MAKEQFFYPETQPLFKSLETLRQRMAEYEQKTAPVLAYYEKQGLLTRVSADADPETVFSRVQAAITSGQ